MSWMPFENTDVSAEQVQSYGEALKALHSFKNAFAEAAPDAKTLDQLTSELHRWTNVLTPMAKPELGRLSGRVPSLPARGHAGMPPFVLDLSDPERVEAQVSFGSYFLGGGGAAHGGTIMTIFDEIMGVQASSGERGIARTAYLKVDFRSTVPLDTPVRVTSWFEQEDGRKRFLRAEMWNGDTLCAEADALFVELREPFYR